MQTAAKRCSLSATIDQLIVKLGSEDVPDRGQLETTLQYLKQQKDTVDSENREAARAARAVPSQEGEDLRL